MQIKSENFQDGQRIPAEFAFGKPGPDAPCIFSDNRNPQLAWSDAPSGTRSFVLMCVDSDAPTKPDDVNQPGRSVPASLPRAEFVHWLMLDISPEVRELGAGSCAEGVIPRGQREPFGPEDSVQGLNDFTDWFAGDADMAGDYFGYDGPCPPWNDELMHHYHFRVFALDVATLGLSGRFTLADVRETMQGHVLAEAGLTGIYTLYAPLLNSAS